MLKATPLDALLKNERVIVIAGMVCLAGLAAAYTVSGAGMKSSAVQATGPGAAMMTHAPWTMGYGVLVMLMWWVMMIAMMVPSAPPMILMFSALKRRRAGLRHPVALTATFVSGYLLIWLAFSALATGLQWALDFARLLAPDMRTGNAALGGSILIAAGLYQFSALKNACLNKCRLPVRFLVERRRPGFTGALRMGLEHGAYCVGCCWLLMALLFVGGIMNLYWIGALALYVLLEKRMGPWLGRVCGALLCVAGAAWIALSSGL